MLRIIQHRILPDDLYANLGMKTRLTDATCNIRNSLATPSMLSQHVFIHKNAQHTFMNLLNINPLYDGLSKWPNADVYVWKPVILCGSPLEPHQRKHNDSGDC